MKTYNSFPDLANSFKLLKISVELESTVDKGGIIGMAINNGLRDKKIKQTIQMIRECHEDNKKMIEEIIPGELLNDILTVKI